MTQRFGIDDPEPWWTRKESLELLWVEDDACRAAGDDTRPTSYSQWPKLFGEELPQLEDALEAADFGDCFLYLYPQGRVRQISYDGDSIFRVVQKEERQGPDLDEYLRAASETTSALLELPEARQPSEVSTLSVDQQDALAALLEAIRRGERVLVLTGPAGTGKTTLAIALEQELTGLGWRVDYMAPTGKAAVRISEVVRKRASTIHGRLFTRVENTKDGVPIFLDPQQIGVGRTAFICDEGSMVGSRLHEQVLAHLGPDAILIYLADPFQLPPVADTWGPDLLNPTAMLTQIHRQAEGSPIIEVATRLRSNQGLPKTQIGDAYRRVSASLGDASTWMAGRLQKNEDAIVLCYSNKTRKKINALVRTRIGHTVRGPLCLNERLVVLQNNHRIGLMNGETIVAEKISWLKSAKEGVVKVTCGEQTFFTMPELIGASREAFEYHRQLNGAIGADPKAWVHLDYAYCLTVHKSQGSQYKSVLFVIDSVMRTMWAHGRLPDGFKICYTAVTRAREELIVMDTR